MVNEINNTLRKFRDDNTIYSAGTGITLTATTFSTKDTEINHDNLNNFIANEHINWTNATVDLETTGDITCKDIVVSGKVDGIDVAGMSAFVVLNSAHRNDNTQAHSDYMLNTGDTVSGNYVFEESTITMNGVLTASSVKISSVNQHDMILSGIPSPSTRTALSCKSDTSGKNVHFELYTYDADGTNDCTFRAYGVASDTAGEILIMGWDKNTNYFKVGSYSNGTGTDRDLYLQTTNHLNHIVLEASTGDVGINTSNPAYKLDVIGDFRVGNTNNYMKISDIGDIVFVGVDNGLCFGSCSAYHMNWTQVAVQNTWYNVSDSDFIVGFLNNVTHDANGKLSVTNAGIYKIDVSCDIEADAVNKHIEIGFEIESSGSAQTEGIVCSETKFANEEHQLSTTALLHLNAGDTIELCVRTTDTGTPTIKVDCVNLNCVQIGGSQN